MTKRWQVLGMLIAGLLLARVVLAAPSAAAIDWWYIGGGGGNDTVGVSSLDGMVGQSVIGMDSEGVCDLCAGFLCGITTLTDLVYDFEVYLPIVIRDLG
jgi:hypothetical protein